MSDRPSTRMRRAAARIVLVLGVTVLALAALGGVAAADDCGDPFDCEETGGFIGITSVVGGIAAVAAAAAAAVAATSGTAGAAAAGAAGTDAGGGDEGGEPPDQVIVQVTSARIEIDETTPTTFQVKAWRVTPTGGYTAAPGVPLSVEAPPYPGLTVTPVGTAGSIDVQVSVDATASPGEVDVIVTGTYKGRATRQRVTIVIGGGYELEIY